MRYKIAVLVVFLALGETFAGCVFDAAEEPTGLGHAFNMPDATPPTPDAILPRPEAMPLGPGCTLTPGYWKTHSTCGDKSLRDMTWDRLPEAEDTPFFDSGYTMCQVMWVSPTGNAYYMLAHAYIAAQLNALAGADFSDAMQAFGEASHLLALYKPGEIALMRGNSMVRSKFISLVAILDAFNNGLIGPGHCDDG